MQFIDLHAQNQKIRESLNHRFNQVFAHCRYIMGPEVAELEQRLANYVGVKHCISVSSGTTALLAAMLALEIDSGDEVITSPFSFISPMELTVLLRAKPVLVDIDPDTYNIDVNKLEAAITPKTKAIIPIDIFGQCADYDVINEIAARHGIPVIQDAAQSFGATYKSCNACGLTAIGCTSFFPSKPLGCYGDGGAVFTDDNALAKRMRQLCNHGQDARYHHTTLGFNGRLDTLQAAVLLAKMDIFDEEVALRQEVAKRYDQLLQGVIKIPVIASFNTSVYAQYTIEVDNRDEVCKVLAEEGIPTAIHYPVPLHKQPVFADKDVVFGDLSVAERAAGRVVSLPFYPYLSIDDQSQVVRKLRMIVKHSLESSLA